MTTLGILGILGALLLISIMWAIWSFTDRYNRDVGGVLSTISIIVLVLTMLICSVTINEEVVFVELKNVVVMRSDRIIILDDGEDFHRLVGYENINKINDSTKFYVMKTKNIWNYEDYEEIVTLLGDTTTIDGYVELNKIIINN